MFRTPAALTSLIEKRTRIALCLLGSAISTAIASSAFALEPSTDHDFVIIGAGAAGLYAAYELDALGYDILILEATGRHGGRVYSDALGDVSIERGAEELYGTLNNFIFNDIKSLYGSSSQTKIFLENASQDVLIQIDGTSTCYVATGNCDADSDIYDYWDFYYDIGNHDNDPSDILVSDHMNTVLGVDSNHRAYHLYEASTPGGEFGTTVERLGLRSLSRQDNAWSLSGDVYGFGATGTTGYLDALNALYFNAVAPSKVSYFSPVVTVDTSGPKPVAIDSNGVYHYAKAILVTVSVGVLKAEIIDFVPDLPAAKIAAYTTIGMGRGLKISARFSIDFWDSKMFNVLSEGPTASCWVPGVYQPASSNHVLTCFIMGNNAQAMSDLPNDTARINQVLSDLDDIFAGAATTNYIEGQVQDWTNNPWVRGSYSYPAPGTYPVSGITMREELANPVGTTLYFAGEATHNTASATVPGAMQSGARAAGEMDTDEGGPPAAGTPTADFSADVTSGSATLNVTFTDSSAPVATGWLWDFGDTGSSSAQNPVHPYTTPGTYTVSLTASNASGDHTIVKPNQITVSSGPVCGNNVLEGAEECDDGNTAPGDGCSAVCLVEECGNNILDPGETCDDGNTTPGDGCSAVCVVEECGNNVIDPGETCDDGNTISGDGCSDLCIVEPAPTANFSADVTSGNAPLLVTFTDLSADGPTSWLWDFGDLLPTSLDQNPVHNYNDPGTYTVSLTATNASGFDVEMKTNYIVVPEPSALISFAAGAFALICLNSRRNRAIRHSRLHQLR